jgi:hypothetical protein
MADQDSPPAPKAPFVAPLPIAAVPKEAPSAPTIRDHAERCSLQPWQVKAVIARLHGLREPGAAEVSEVTRMDSDTFDEALDQALHGRI